MKQTDDQTTGIEPLGMELDVKQIEPTHAATHSSVESESPADAGRDQPTTLADRLLKRALPTSKKSFLRKFRWALLAVLLVTFGVVLYRSLTHPEPVRVSLTAKSTDSSDAASQSNKSPEDTTSEALAEIKTILSKPNAVRAPSSGAGAPQAEQQNQSLGPPPPPLSLPPENASANKTGDSPERQASQPRSLRNQEHSIRFTLDDNPNSEHLTPVVASTQPRPVAALRLNQPNRQALSSKSIAAPVVLPSFGAMLPVRTLGKIYTLRSGSTIRLELTRFVEGEGWSLAKGTTLIGQIRGSEQDRAFIAITGFIDRDRDRFVKLNGEILGDDGGSGLHGKFHKLSSGWSRAFARVASTAVNVAGAVASSRISGQPVIITDAGSRAITPFSSEIDSSLLQQARGFVEVPAGTAGFVMVTTLPAGVEGIDAEPQSDSNGASLTQDEVASLLTSGDPVRIRAALPRMSPQMRSIAEVVLAESARQTPNRD